MFLLFSCSVLSDSFATPWTVTHQAPLSIEFSSQEYWSGLPFPLPRDLPDPGLEFQSPAFQADSTFWTTMERTWVNPSHEVDTSTVFLYLQGPTESPPRALERDFLPSLLATSWLMLTQVDAEQPKFEETTLAPPTDLVCVPDQERFPCLSEGPHPTFLGPHWAGSEACRAKSGWEQF